MRSGLIRHFVYVPFPAAFKETLAPHIAALWEKGAVFVFESSWKKPYSTRGVRAMLARCAGKAGLDHNMPPHACATSSSPGSKGAELHPMRHSPSSVRTVP